MFLTIVSIYVLIIQLLKLIYLIFKPKFLNSERFGPPKSKIMLAAYYVIAIFCLLLLILEEFNIIRIEIVESNDIQFPIIDTTLWLLFLIGGLLTIIVTWFIKKNAKKTET